MRTNTWWRPPYIEKLEYKKPIINQIRNIMLYCQCSGVNMRVFVAANVLFWCFCCALGSGTPRTWVVDLDKSPSERWPWKEMVPIYGKYLQGALQMVKAFIPEWWEQDVIEEIMESIVPMLGDYGEEITSGAKLLNLPLGEAVLLNLIYEVEASCTSIVAFDNDGRVIHGRNLDFNLAKVLRNLTIDVDFQSKGKTIYKGTTYAGYVGLLTGMRLGSTSGFSVSLDQRTSGSKFEDLLEALFGGGRPVCFVIRDTLETAEGFARAVDILAGTPLIAPSYIIVGGTTAPEGVVITRDREDAANLWYLADQSQADMPGWFRVETNFDWWKPAGDHRRATAVASMEHIGPAGISLQGLYSTLSTHPVLNDATTYTNLMSASLGNYSTVVR